MSTTKLNNHFIEEDPWRIFRIMSEFVDGFETLSKVHSRAICIFGSAVLPPKHKYCKLAEQTAYKLAKMGYTIITGGGPAVMESANKGACRAGGQSVGLNIIIPSEQRPNPYLTLSLEFKYFFVRKVMFAKYAKAFIVFPGGYGTLDELTEGMTLIQTERVNPFPIILVGKNYWDGLLKWMQNTLVKEKTINSKDLNIIKTVDTVDEIISVIKKCKI